MYNLKQMEMAFYERNKREYELTKHISLAQLDASALLQLKETGQCFIRLPEELFDIDYPGHYFRRIKIYELIYSMCCRSLHNRWMHTYADE